MKFPLIKLLLLLCLPYFNGEHNNIEKRELLFSKWRLIETKLLPMKQLPNADAMNVQSELTLNTHDIPLTITFFSTDSFKCNQPLLSIEMGERYFQGTSGIWNLDTSNKTLLLIFTKDIQILFLVKKVDDKQMELVFVGQKSFSNAADKLNDYYLKFTFDRL